MQETPMAKKLSPAELDALLQSNAGVLLIDSLPKARYQQVHLPGSVNACVYEVTFVQQVDALSDDRQRQVVVYGDSRATHDAAMAASKLLRAGYSRVAILDGGLAAWREAGLALEGEQPSAGDSVSQLADGHHRIDTATSVIEWAGRNPTTTHWGTLRLASGEIRVKNGTISGSFVLDMNSIANINLAGDKLQPVLEDHLKSDDFFFVSRFPSARFEMTAQPTSSDLPASSPNYLVNGHLTLCGVSAEQEFMATITSDAEGKLHAVAHFDFDRTRWGVIYGSTRFFRHLGMHLVFDLISLQLRLVTE